MVALGSKPRQHGSTLNGKRGREAFEAELSSLQHSLGGRNEARSLGN